MNENKYTTLHYSLDSQNQEKPFLETGENYEHTKTLNFIRDRLVEVHGEPENLDYMHKLNNAIAFVERMEEPLNLCGNNCEAKDKPKRTKVEWFAVGSEEAVYWFMETEGDLYDAPDESNRYVDIQDYINTLSRDGSSSLYRKVETKLTEREEFIETAKVLCSDFDTLDAAMVIAMYDSGKFKLAD